MQHVADWICPFSLGGGDGTQWEYDKSVDEAQMKKCLLDPFHSVKQSLTICCIATAEVIGTQEKNLSQDKTISRVINPPPKKVARGGPVYLLGREVTQKLLLDQKPPPAAPMCSSAPSVVYSASRILATSPPLVFSITGSGVLPGRTGARFHGRTIVNPQLCFIVLWVPASGCDVVFGVWGSRVRAAGMLDKGSGSVVRARRQHLPRNRAHRSASCASCDPRHSEIPHLSLFRLTFFLCIFIIMCYCYHKE